MDNNKFLEIVQFAIDREIEAAEFYSKLSEQVKSDEGKVMLKDLERMELGHAGALEAFKRGSIQISFAGDKIPDIKLSDFMVVPNQGEDITYQSIFVLAMKREEAAKNLYLKLADEAGTDEAKDMFFRLANEEAKHKFQLESLYDEEILREN